MEDKDRIIDDNIAVLDDIKRQLKSMENMLSSSKEELLFYKDNVFEKERLLEYMKKELTSLYTKFIIKYQQTYSRLSNLFAFTYPFERKREKLDKELLKHTKFVKATVDKNNLYVKMPYLPIKIFRKTYVFQDVLRQALEGLKIPYMSSKTIYILHVFKEGTSLYIVPDNDNYDFKRYVDIICDYIGGGDAGVSTQFVLNSIYSNVISEGSYFIVSPSKKFKKTDKIVKRLQKIFSQ